MVYSLCIAWSVATILVGYLICTPLSRLWTLSAAGHCANTTAAYISLGVFDVALDMAVFTLPIPVLYKLQVPKHTKIVLLATFALGLLTIVAGIMRMVAVIRIDFNADVVEGVVANAYWCSIESAVGIIVACCLTLRPLLDRIITFLARFFPQLQSTNKSRRTATHEFSKSDPVKSTASSHFVRLYDSQELPLQGLSRDGQESRKESTNRASTETV